MLQIKKEGKIINKMNDRSSAKNTYAVIFRIFKVKEECM